MSNYHRDDGTTSGGIITIVCILIAFSFGYWVRDRGFVLRVETPKTELRR